MPPYRFQKNSSIRSENKYTTVSVSYTHLDVYKRQAYYRAPFPCVPLRPLRSPSRFCFCSCRYYKRTQGGLSTCRFFDTKRGGGRSACGPLLFASFRFPALGPHIGVSLSVCGLQLTGYRKPPRRFSFFRCEMSIFSIPLMERQYFSDSASIPAPFSYSLKRAASLSANSSFAPFLLPQDFLARLGIYRYSPSTYFWISFTSSAGNMLAAD